MHKTCKHTKRKKKEMDIGIDPPVLAGYLTP